MTCNDVLFWTELSGEQRVGSLGYDCRSSGFSGISNREVAPAGVAADAALNLVFWTNDATDHASPSTGVGYISRSKSDGTLHSIILENVTDPRGMHSSCVQHCVPTESLYHLYCCCSLFSLFLFLCVLCLCA